MEEYKIEERRAVLVGAEFPHNTDFDLDMEELSELCKALSIRPLTTLTQSLPTEDKATFIGSGKVEEVKEAVLFHEANLVLFLNPLSPSQLHNLSKALPAEVLDRTQLILRIFSERAKTKEAKIQVKYATLEYMLPRLVGLRENLSRQGGAAGALSNRGAGEKQIELDRRKIQDEMALLRRELKKQEAVRKVKRQKRENSTLSRVALVGYTNAGKSSLMNALLSFSKEQLAEAVEEKDMLFATLDTTVRRIVLEKGEEFLLADTVGFIRSLPDKLLDAFHSTLEEAVEADLILQVIDYSDPNYRKHMDTTVETLKKLGASHIPTLYILNKCDKVLPLETLPKLRGEKLYISVKEGIGIKEVADAITKALSARLRLINILLPYKESAWENRIRSEGKLLSLSYEEEGILLQARVPVSLEERLKPYQVVRVD